MTITASLDHALNAALDGSLISSSGPTEFSTVAYLGEALAPNAEDGNTLDLNQAGFALMHQLNAIWGDESNLGHYNHQERQLRPHSEWAQMQIPGVQTMGDLSVWMPLLHLCSQPWFSRSWVLQEVSLAKDVLVFYGSAVDQIKTRTRFWTSPRDATCRGH
ncbi:hypothetical protein MMYC01_204546 [Madurella mycetomatis]|uniref:Heterokaryon incompatibility domain-containing protein n=1 Tax=Madurella mycetomatis TaxID=100816 RepID=A0A175W780_9PEZI|nr:hypothetical protein MMYC01_207987 [Madurella mycetomatis]KXX79331.1 hypothetical protein MMYC01_204546 [Madurella mycetomatis]